MLFIQSVQYGGVISLCAGESFLHGHLLTLLELRLVGRLNVVGARFAWPLFCLLEFDSAAKRSIVEGQLKDQANEFRTTETGMVRVVEDVVDAEEVGFNLV